MDNLHRVLRNRLLRIALLALCLMTLQCRSGAIDALSVLPAEPPLPYEEIACPKLNCSQEYAGELLAYFMRVVLGQAGQLHRRDAWRTRATDHPLDLGLVAAKMNDAGQDKSQLMVLDTNMLGFSEVLYHYDPQLNHFKGRFANHSLYPSSGLIALRMLLVKKIHQGEKVDLKAVMDRKPLLLDPAHEPSHRTLEKMNLHLDEYRLLRDVFLADPQLVRYLGNPFLVKSLADVGAIRNDRYVREISRRANYRKIYPPNKQVATRKPAVTIAILPSMTKEFLGCDNPNKSGIETFAPTETYLSAAAGLQQAILEKAATRLAQIGPPSAGGPSPWARLLQEQVRFFNAEKRPLLVYPQNIDQVLADICPDADIVIVILGKNVYSAVDIDPERDTYPEVNRIYLDIGDVRYGYCDTELDQVSDLVYRRIKNFLPRQPQHTERKMTANSRLTGPDGLNRPAE